MAKIYNRAWMTVTGTPGTGTITLNAAFSDAYCTFAEAGVANSDVVAYVLEDGDDFEIGIGTYTSSGTTLSRTTVRLSKEAGVAGTAKITASSSASVFILPAKEDFIAGFTDLADPGGDRIAFWDDSAGILTWLTLSGLTITTTSLAVDAASDSAAGKIEIAVQSEMESASSTTLAVVPGRQHYHPSAAKVWCDWGIATTINADYGVSTITDNGTGDWTVNFDTAFSAANYAATPVAEHGATSGNFNCSGVRTGGQATGSVRVHVCIVGDGATATDPTSNYVACFGDH